MCPKSLHARYLLLFYIIPSTLANNYGSPRYSTTKKIKLLLGYPEDSLLNFTELTAKYGYVSEEHKVITDDRYILTMFRIIKAKNCVGKIRSPPVLLLHGLLQSSDSWIDSGPDSGLAYLISDACYDLWLGNSRGNYYSRHHISLDPDKDYEFWNFDGDTMGTYDIPAMIDYVLNYTGSKKLNYIGFSQGAGVFMVMCSERPGYCEKAQLVIALSPAITFVNAKSEPFRVVLENLEKTDLSFGRYRPEEVLPRGSIVQELMAFFCRLTDFSRLCDLSLQILDHAGSYHLKSISVATIKKLFGRFPSGTSLRNIVWYNQNIKTGLFRKYNYGSVNNLVMYGTEEPPMYNLSSVTVPVVCIFGRNDGLIDVKDIKWFVSQLPNVVEVFEVEDPLWTHLDVAYSQYTKTAIFPKISAHLFSNSFT